MYIVYYGMITTWYFHDTKQIIAVKLKDHGMYRKCFNITLLDWYVWLKLCLCERKKDPHQKLGISLYTHNMWPQFNKNLKIIELLGLWD